MVIVEDKCHWYEKRIRFTAETPRTQRVKVHSPLGRELREERQITFEEAVFCLMHGGLLDTIEHPNREKYPDQRIFIINVEDYVYLVPFVETEECIFLKTIIPSRKMTKKYLGGKKNETQ